MNKLASIIKSAREMSGLTIREAEVKSGISNAYLSQIENGKIKKPSLQILHKICEVYDIPFDILIQKAGLPLPDYGIRKPFENIDFASILIADDSSEDRMLFIDYLNSDKNCSYNIIESESGVETFEAAVASQPDCIVLDYKLPDLNGLEVLKKISEDKRTKGIPVIMMTGFGSEDIVVSAMKLGAANYLIKGRFTKEEFVDSVKNGLKRKILRDIIKSHTVKTKPSLIEWNKLSSWITMIDDTVSGLAEKGKGSPLHHDLKLLQDEISDILKWINSIRDTGTKKSKK